MSDACAGDEAPADLRRGGLASGKELENVLRNDNLLRRNFRDEIFVATAGFML